MNYIEKIYIKSDEVYHYPWLNQTDINITLTKEFINNEKFKNYSIALLIASFKKVVNIKPDFIIGVNDLTLKFCEIADNDKITMYLEKVCDYIIAGEYNFKQPKSEVSLYIEENKETIIELFKEIKHFITQKEIKYYAQAVDGFN